METLQAKANRVVEEYTSMVRRRACWAADVMLSASSRIIILWRFGGRFTLFIAKLFILLRTTSIPLASLAFWNGLVLWGLGCCTY